MTVKSKTKKIISTLFIVLILMPAILLFSPKKSYAIWGVADAPVDAATNISTGIGTQASTTATASSSAAQLALKLKDVAIEVGKQLLKAVAKRVLAEMTKSIINWINNGFHGSPLFLENPQSFFNDIAKSELKTIVDMFGYDALRYPFGKQFALNAINSYKSQLATNAQYTLSTVMNSAQLRLYQNDFNYGGWNGFLINTQYPQNNYLGFNMLATEDLARRVQGTAQNAAQKVQSLLQQGAGFLSPQTCPKEINPSYNNGYNEFNRPSFTYDVPYPTLTGEGSTDFAPGPADQAAIDRWNANRADSKEQWEEKNTCLKADGTSGLVNTTPGSIAKDQIAGALNAPILQTALDGALGNSLSAIFDALINKFIGDGLNALASKVNPAPVSDDWSYNGITLGSPVDVGTNSTWNVGPEQPIVLRTFKNQISGYFIGTCSNLKDEEGNALPSQENIERAQCDDIRGTWTKNPAGRDYVKGDIDTTQEELDLIYYDVTITTDSVGKITNDPDNFPGIHQMLGRIWPKAQKLDECIPGPDLGWQKRLDEEVERIKKELQEKSGGMIGGGNVPASEAVVKELTSAVSFFKDWINDKIMSELDSSVSFVDAVSSVKALSEEMDQLKGKRETRSRALVRLKAIEKGLSKITTQPTIGSAGEKSLISLWKQYQAAKLDLSNTNTVEETRNKLSEAIDLYNNFIDSMDPSKDTSCPYEREDSKKWYYRPNTTQGLLNVSGQSDLLLFCALPIRGGYDHGGVGKGGNQLFSHENDIGGPQPVTHPEIPLVNAREVWDYEIITLESLGKSIGASFIIGGGLFSPLSLYEEAWYDINLNCDNIFNAGILEYKGKLPGNTSGSSTTGPTLGNCTYSNGTVETNKTKKQCELETGTWGPLEPLGVCSVPIPNTNPVQTLSVPNTTRLSCTTYNGTWTSNSGGNPTTPPPATPNNLVFTPANLSIEITEENQLPSLIRISGGTPPYAVISPQDTGVFIVKILSITPNFLTVTGYSSGTSSVFIMDSSNPSKFASINIKVEVNLPINI